MPSSQFTISFLHMTPWDTTVLEEVLNQRRTVIPWKGGVFWENKQNGSGSEGEISCAGGLCGLMVWGRSPRAVLSVRPASPSHRWPPRRREQLFR